MLRRKFLKSIGAMAAISAVPAICPAKDDSWKTNPITLRWSDEKNIWTIDEFIQINLKKDKDAVYGDGKYRFRLLKNGNCTVLITLKDETISHHVEIIPLETADKMYSKDEFIKQFKRSYRKDTVYFEIFNEDKSKSNLLAFWNQ